MHSLPWIKELSIVLERCRRQKRIEHLLHLRAYLCYNGLENHPAVANHLVCALAEACRMGDACKVFDKLIHIANEVSWNYLITGYICDGRPDIAFTLFQKVYDSSYLHLERTTVAALVKTCAELNNMEIGMKIHGYIAKEELLYKDAFIGSALVNMYARCGALLKAQNVIDEFQLQDIVSWTALIAGYLGCGNAEDALSCFEQMQREGMSPDVVAYVAALKACTRIGAFEKGQIIHVELSKKGLETHLLVGNILVDMYVKYRQLAKAEYQFNKLSFRTVVAWTALISGYTDNGFGEEALILFDKMQLDGVQPDSAAYLCSLKACCSIDDSNKSQEVYSEIIRKGLETNTILSILVDIYAKGGLLSDAQYLFNKIQVQDVVLWTSMISGYVEQQYFEESLELLWQMISDGVSPDDVTFSFGLRACSSLKAKETGCYIHQEITKRGLEGDLMVGNSLVDMYAKCGAFVNAQEAFLRLVVKDVVSWTGLISGFVEHGLFREALDYFDQMHYDGVSPDSVSFFCGLRASGVLGAKKKGEEIHTEIVVIGLEGDAIVSNGLVDMYVKCGSLSIAVDVFNDLETQNIVSWTALIGGFADTCQSKEALIYFEKMIEEDVSPNTTTLVSVLKASGNLGAINTCTEIHSEILHKGLEIDIILANTLVDMYAKLGLAMDAQYVFDKLLFQDEVTWNALIAGYAQTGQSEIIFLLLEQMLSENINLDTITLVSVLTACNHAGQVMEGQVSFIAMSSYYNINVTKEHYNCMVDLFGRSGQFDFAVALINKMPFHPTAVLWHSVLGLCQKWGNLELAKHAFDHVMDLDETDAAAYISLLNTFMDNE